MQLERHDIEQEEEEAETERFFGGTVKIAPDNTRENLRVALCEFSAGEKIKKSETADSTSDEPAYFEVRASYVIAIRPNKVELDGDTLKRTFSDLAKTSAWSLFRSLFSQIASQGNTQHPHLPIDPAAKIKIAID